MIKDGNITLEKAKRNQDDNKSDLNKIKKGKSKSNKQKSALYNIEKLLILLTVPS